MKKEPFVWYVDGVPYYEVTASGQVVYKSNTPKMKGVDIILPDGFDGGNKIILAWPRTKSRSARYRLALVWVRAHGYDHGEWCRKIIAKSERALLKRRRPNIEPELE